ncbi:hypothetical protein GWI33_021194 [Rhynchophorus ferrugineus]|uniref:Uncharacterized protein n=1 Tax=Rhynchophorus ferrugineus TaxID=354439 RepID=A0A834HT15_RHYFE|nr:hypothetical protein GWI33_021194 [Rhynchophorus ferrugineus]
MAYICLETSGISDLFRTESALFKRRALRNGICNIIFVKLSMKFYHVQKGVQHSFNKNQHLLFLKICSKFRSDSILNLHYHA